MNILSKITVFLILIPLLFSCKSSSKTAEENPDEIPQKKVVMDKKQAAENYQGALFDKAFTKKNGGAFSFAESNTLWKASIKALDFVPLQSLSYSGGVIITDWYSGSKNPMESIKITVNFKSADLATTSVEVSSFKKICKVSGECSTSKMNNVFNQAIKDKILGEARKLELAKKKK
tara:strand:+ start:404 stop:931 length:528 start_codon:yes stop_codon:yes gene_type:complete